jgi:hypothetical protein
VPNGTILKALKTCYFSCFSDAQIQSNPNEKLFCLLEHLNIDVVKLGLGWYGFNRRNTPSAAFDHLSRHPPKRLFRLCGSITSEQLNLLQQKELIS